MALPFPPPYINPIPNNPFYSVPVYITKGAYYPITVGSGLSVDPVTAIMTSAGGGGGGVTSVTAGSGISVSASTGAVTITNAGITSIVAGSGISVSTVGGVSTITNLKNGTVTSINTGTGLTGGPIIAFGTISLANTAVTPGIYSNPSLTIDAQGRITSATSGTALQTLTASLPLTLTAGVNPTIAINPATTLACGAVLLSDSTASTSSVTAATSNALKTAYDIAVAAIPKSCITGKGALITGIAASTPVALTAGTDGKVLTTCAACPEGLYWGTGGGSSVSSATPVAEGIVYGCTPSAVNSNVALGYDTQGTTGTQNVTVGWSAGKAVTGAYNVFTGYAAGCSLATGVGNTTVGWGTMCNIPNGTDNIAIGGAALLGNLAGPAAICCNIAIGTNSLWDTTGCKNIAIGWGAGDLLTTGCCNVIIGNLVQAASSTGSGQLAIGYGTNRWLTGVSDGAIKPGAGVIDCTTSCGISNMVLTSQGNAVQWKNVSSAIANPNYGVFIDSSNQTITTPSTPQPVQLTSQVAGTNFSIVGGSRITAAIAGVYNLQFSIQLFANPGGGGPVEVWLAKNGVAVPSSNTRFTIKNTNEAEFAALNYVESLAAGQYLELIWSTADSDNFLYSATSPTALGGPAIPAVIVTIVPVGA